MSYDQRSPERRFKKGDKFLDTGVSSTRGLGTVIDYISSTHFTVKFEHIMGTYERWDGDKELILLTPLMEVLF
jgi:hypothetical protein